MKSQRGFTLLEVIVALAILGISLMVLLEAQVSSLNNAGRARALTIGSLLARSKMIDIEQKLFDEGFTMGDQAEEGDFSEEGHPEIKWKVKITEVEMNLSTLSSLCGEAGEEAGMGCEGMLSGIGGMLEGITTEIANSIRIAELTVTWPDGKYSESMKVNALITKEDLSAEAAAAANQLLGGQLPGTGGAPGAGGGTGAQTPTPTNPLGGGR